MGSVFLCIWVYSSHVKSLVTFLLGLVILTLNLSFDFELILCRIVDAFPAWTLYRVRGSLSLSRADPNRDVGLWICPVSNVTRAFRQIHSFTLTTCLLHLTHSRAMSACSPRIEVDAIYQRQSSLAIPARACLRKLTKPRSYTCQ